jgi:tetratricopeptide (TPR) repeat protein
MPTPHLRQFFPVTPKDGQAERIIDNQYQLEMVADDEGQLVEYLLSAYQVRRDAAVAQLRGLVDYAAPKTGDDVSALLPILTAGAAEPADADAAFRPADVVREGAVAAARAMADRRLALSEIFAARRDALEENTVELLDEAARALRSGMTSTGRDQQEEFKDALRLLRSTQEGPIGGRNYVTWFQVGWLLWKLEKNLPDAAEAFYQAYRLSASQADLYHLYALRHHAYLQSLQGKHEEALLSAQRAARLAPDDTDVLFDLARYAARLGRENEVLEPLGRCIDADPTVAATAFADPDFAPLAGPVASLILARTDAGRKAAEEAVTRLRRAIGAVRQAGASAGVTVALPARAPEAADAAGALLARAGDALPLSLGVGIARAAERKAAEVVETGVKGLEDAIAETDKALLPKRRRVERLTGDKRQWETMMAALTNEAREIGVRPDIPPKRPPKFKWMPVRRNVRVEQLRMNYQSCRSNLSQTEAHIREEMPSLQADLAAGDAQRARYAAALAELKAGCESL